MSLGERWLPLYGMAGTRWSLENGDLEFLAHVKNEGFLLKRLWVLLQVGDTPPPKGVSKSLPSYFAIPLIMFTKKNLGKYGTIGKN